MKSRQRAPRLTLGHAIESRDGALLRANLYLPPEGERFVTVLQLTPYTADSLHPWASRMARNGFAFLAVECRGTGGSLGEFRPFRDDGPDGRDAVEWAARQAWSDGRVVMSGGSYAGFTQWATAALRPPHLCAIAPIASVHPGWDFPAIGGIFHTYVVRWLSLVHGTSGNERLFADGDFWTSRQHEALATGAGLREQGAILGRNRAILDAWLAHPGPDRYWRSTVPSARGYSAIRFPVLTVTGQYDGDQPGALRYYAQHLRHCAGASSRHDLVIGPWDHAGTREPKRKFAGLSFGPRSVFDMRDFLCEWYRWALGEGPRPALLPSRVALYVAGEEQWRHGASLRDLAVAAPAFFPSARRARATSLANAGALARTPPAQHVAAYQRDPLDIREGRIELDRVEGFSGSVRTKAVEGTGLVFETAALRRDMLLVGRATITAWIRLDRPDADFSSRLEVILPGGRVVAIGRSQLRARFRKSRSRAQFALRGRWHRYEFDGLQYIARRVGAGSRLRLVITTPVSAGFERNTNTGRRLAGGPIDGALPVRVEIALGGARACRLRFETSPASASE